MKAILKKIYTLVIVSLLLLTWAGVLRGEVALLVGASVELVAAYFIIRTAWIFWRQSRRVPTDGTSFQTLLQSELEKLYPRTVARLIVIEPVIWVSLYRWLFQRRPLAAHEFSYDKRTMYTTVLALLVMTAPVETLLYELLLPWVIVKVVLLVGTVYSIIWFAGLRASLKTRPYRLEATGLRLYYGLLAEAFVPYRDIAGVKVQRTTAPAGARSEGLKVIEKQATAYLPVGGRADLTLTLSRPITFQQLFNTSAPALTVHLAADEPGKLAQALQAKLSEKKEPAQVG